MNSLQLVFGKEETSTQDLLDMSIRLGGDTKELFRISIDANKNAKQGKTYDRLQIGCEFVYGKMTSIRIAQDKKTKEFFAVKSFQSVDKRAIHRLTTFDCECLVTMKGIDMIGEEIGIINEFMDLGNIKFIVEKKIPMSENVFAAISYQIIWGLGYLHYEGVIHGRLKPTKILMNSKGEIKLSGFAISEDLEKPIDLKQTITNFCYYSPERLLGESYDRRTDIWSAGIVLIELWNKRLPFETATSCPTILDLYEELQHFQFDKVSSSLHGLSRKGKKWLKKLLVLDPNERLSCLELSQAEWFGACGVSGLPAAQKIISKWLTETPLIDDILEETRPLARRSGLGFRPILTGYRMNADEAEFEPDSFGFDDSYHLEQTMVGMSTIDIEMKMLKK